MVHAHKSALTLQAAQRCEMASLTSAFSKPSFSLPMPLAQVSSLTSTLVYSMGLPLILSPPTFVSALSLSLTQPTPIPTSKSLSLSLLCSLSLSLPQSLVFNYLVATVSLTPAFCLACSSHAEP